MESLTFSLYFLFYTIFSDTETLEKEPLRTTPYERFGWNFFHFWLCLHAKNQYYPAIPSGDICDPRILQSNWLTDFTAITQKQEFPQIWGLYSKIGNNINFYLNTFPGKINDKILKIKEKNPFFVIFDHIWSYLPKGDFSWKIRLSTIAVVPQHLNTKYKE